MPKILIIEDEMDLAEIYRTALEAAGHEIVGIFSNPLIAMSASIPTPDLILLDERLEGMSGSLYIERLKAHFPGTIVLMATADAEVAIEARNRGAVEGKLKPFSMKHLIGNIEGLLRKDNSRLGTRIG